MWPASIEAIHSLHYGQTCVGPLGVLDCRIASLLAMTLEEIVGIDKWGVLTKFDRPV